VTVPVGHPVLAVIVRTAVGATGASSGWLLAVDDGELRVVASTGTPAPALSATVSADAGAAGFVAASGQPLAVAPRGDDRFSEGMVALLGHVPTSILGVPCLSDDIVVGVIELVDKAGGGSFSFDDVELATLLAGIAGVGLTTFADRLPDVPAPAQLGGDLARLATTDPGRYAGVASAVAALLSG
jgi:sigma-B regulation protein RsbU (phosphoserine phosphatase)